MKTIKSDGIFVTQQPLARFLSYFLSILKRKVFVDPDEKCMDPTQKFSFSSSQPNNTQIHFLSKVFHLPISPPNKHTLIKETELEREVKNIFILF